MKIVSTKQMRSMDEKAIQEYQIPGILLMEHAAMAVKKHIDLEVTKQKHILILCGPGNNGGDGFALARLLVQDGYQHVEIVCPVPFSKMSHDEAIYAQMAKQYQIPIIQKQDIKVIERNIQTCDYIIDALFGTGMTREVEGFYKELIETVNDSKKCVMSIDIASGIHGDSGKVMGCAIQAQKTVSFECYKQGNVIYPGSMYCGNVVVESIQMPQQIVQETVGIPVMDDSLIASYLPIRQSHSNKGSYGKCLLIGGSMQMHGAITLTAKAALRSGIGTLTLAIPACIYPIISQKIEECMYLPLPDEDGMFSIEASMQLKETLKDYDLIVIGNGMGRRNACEQMVQMVLESKLPCVIDGDAIYHVGNHPEWLHRSGQTILTPHPKEMSYLTKQQVKEIVQDPIHAIHTFTKQYPNVTLVYKDEHSIVCGKTQWAMNLAGNQALAKGGSGDVLCGILTGLFGQSKDAFQSACCAVYIHACCADELRKQNDSNSILPSDLITMLSKIYQRLRR